MTCKYCNTVIYEGNRNYRYCSKECRYEMYKKRLRESISRACKRCGKVIEAPLAGSRARLYCSDYWHTGKDGKFRVYILHRENYAGMSAKIFDRMIQHEDRGKYIEDMEVVGIFDNPIEAHLLETQLHLEGYEGFYVEKSHLDT